MQAIILLLNAIFAKLTTAVNKAYTKSQRGSLVFTQSGDFFQTGTTIINSANQNTSNKTLLQQIDDLGRGDGDYSVIVQMPAGDEMIYVYSDGTGHNSTIIVRKTGSILSIVSKTDSIFERIVSKVGDLIFVAKGEAIAAAELDATTKVNSSLSKSQRGSIVFNGYPLWDNNQLPSAKNFSLDEKTYEGQTVKQAIDAMGRGDGLYEVVLEFAEIFANPFGTLYADGVGHGSVIIVTKAGNDFTIVSKTSGAGKVLNSAKEYTDAQVNILNNSINDAIQDAHDYADTKANEAYENAKSESFENTLETENTLRDEIGAAKGQAIDTANLYTDAEIAKLQQYASIGIKSFKTFEGLVSAGPTANTETIANLPSYVAFGIPTTETGSHIIQVTGVNADGSIVDDKEFTMVVPTGVDANGDATTTTIQVSTNDKLIVELYKLADGSFFMKYVQKYDDRLMEVVKQLIVKIDTQVSESELLNAVTDVKTYVDAQINAALV